MNNTQVNITLSTHLDHMGRDVAILVLYLLTAFLAIVGNTLVCYTIRQRKHLRNCTTYKLIYWMAISDIIGGAAIPGQMFMCSTIMLDLGWVSMSLCALMKTMQIMSYYVSSLTMLSMAYDRYRLVCHPQARPIKAKRLLIACWTLSLVFILMNLFSMRVNEFFSPTDGIITCRVVFETRFGTIFKRARYMFLLSTQYVLPLSLTAIFYFLVAKRIWQRQEMTGTKSTDKLEQFDQRKRDTIRMLVIVTVLFALSYVPNHVVHLLKYYTSLLPKKKSTKCHSSTFYMLCYWLAVSNCAYNPFVYCYFNRSSLNIDKSILPLWIKRLGFFKESKPSAKEISLTSGTISTTIDN